MSRLAAIAVAGSFLAFGAIISAAAAEDQEPRRETPEHIWASSCSYCQGGPMNAPTLFGRGLPEQAIIAIVRHGANGMPPFHPSAIGDADLQALARWIAQRPAPEAQQRQ